MADARQQIINLIADSANGVLPVESTWSQIEELKHEYVEQYGQQSWNSFIGHRFEGLIHAILKGYAKKLRQEYPAFDGFQVLTQTEAKHDEVLMRKLAIRYGDFLLLPDIDSVIAWKDAKRQWNSEVLAIISCKTSLRERIAQSCYWKLKLVSSDVQKGIRMFLATVDNDEDFTVVDGGERYDGKTRDRIISEHELDGVYILREDFSTRWESAKVKRFERIFDDMVEIMKNRPSI